MTNRIKILWVGDGGVASGFARVNHSIIGELSKDKYEVHHLAVNYRGDPYPGVTSTMYPALLGGDLYGMGRIKSLVEQIKPDMIFILNDIWITAQYMNFIPKNYEGKIVCYFPVDAAPLSKQWFDAVIDRDATLVAYTEYGRLVAAEHVKDREISIIPHGIDTETFFPIDMWEARQKMSSLKEDDFIVLNANRNQPRKRHDLLIKGFARFVKGKSDNIKLYCHCGVEDLGYHLLTLCERYNLSNRLILTSLELSPANFVSDERLNWIYNSANIGINCSAGEGWGLPSFEHGACRRAQIVPNSSACIELWTGRGQLLDIDHYYTYPQVLTEGAEVSIAAIEKTLNYYYENPEAVTRDANAAYDYITQPKFNWHNIAEQWNQLFDKVLEE